MGQATPNHTEQGVSLFIPGLKKKKEWDAHHNGNALHENFL